MKIKRNCKTCSKEFYTIESKIKAGKGLYCCKQCYTDYKNLNGIKNLITDHCIICGKGIHLTEYLREIGRKCCSRKCSGILQTRRNTRTTSCKFCKKELKTKISEIKIFCNWECRRDFLDASKTTYICECCNKSFRANKRERRNNRKHYFCSNTCKFTWHNGKPHPAMSEWLAENISNGNFIPRHQSYYIQGYLLNTSTDKKEWYSSSYEKERMLQLNSQNIKWTKNHGIKIPYVDVNGRNHYYIPDILVGDKILEEIKPVRLIHLDNNPEKFFAAKKYCSKNNLTFKIITEKELGIKL